MLTPTDQAGTNLFEIAKEVGEELVGDPETFGTFRHDRGVRRVQVILQPLR